METLHGKKQNLENYLRKLGSVAVAFSSGVDSAFLLKVAHDVLGDKAIAVTVSSRSFPARELSESIAFCKAEGIEQAIVEFDEFSVDGFAKNPPDRCYLCKRELFGRIIQTASERGISYVAEGSNTDDNGDYRPGLKAVAELGVKSPLREADLSKSEIRILSKEMGMPTWNKPSFACLATRFVYGEEITAEKLYAVERAEQRLIELGFRQVRVRVHGNIARIEISPNDFIRLISPDTAHNVTEYFKEIGFLYVTLDLEGYQTGSMNRTLKI